VRAKGPFAEGKPGRAGAIFKLRVTEPRRRSFTQGAVFQFAPPTAKTGFKIGTGDTLCRLDAGEGKAFARPGAFCGRAWWGVRKSGWRSGFRLNSKGPGGLAR